MSTECQPSAIASATPVEASVHLGKRRSDQIDEPARPLGAKRAALQIRRQQTSGAAARSTCKGDDADAVGVLVASSDSTVTWAVRTTAVGLLVERTQVRSFGARLMQTMIFGNAASFDRWCETETIRFEDPMAYAHLRRQGHEALDRRR